MIVAHSALLWGVLQLQRPSIARKAVSGARVSQVRVVSLAASRNDSARPAAEVSPLEPLPEVSPAPVSGILDAQPAMAPPEQNQDGRIYIPRAWLDVPPVLLRDVHVAFPPVEGFVELTIDVALLVDDAGIVQHVEVRTPDVHEAFVQAVTDAFSKGRFKPGEIAGVPVPCELRIQVEFRA